MPADNEKYKKGRDLINRGLLTLAEKEFSRFPEADIEAQFHLSRIFYKRKELVQIPADGRVTISAAASRTKPPPQPAAAEFSPEWGELKTEAGRVASAVAPFRTQENPFTIDGQEEVISEDDSSDAELDVKLEVSFRPLGRRKFACTENDMSAAAIEAFAKNLSRQVADEEPESPKQQSCTQRVARLLASSLGCCLSRVARSCQREPVPKGPPRVKQRPSSEKLEEIRNRNPTRKPR